MFSKIEISIGRAFFWPVANLIYWGLIFLAWWDTRFKVFLGVSIIEKFGELRSFSAVMDNLGELQSRAYISVAENGAMQGEFMMIPLVMAVVLFVVPFVVRRDYKGPVTGFVVLPSMTLLCYFFSSFLNLIVVAAMSAGIHYLLFKVPGPDIFMFMVHPLYIIYPIFRSVPGFAAQILYLVYTASVLCTDSMTEEEYTDDGDEGPYESDGVDDWDKSACLMEMDRLSRILNTKFGNPSFMDRIRSDAASYINRPGQIRNEVKLGQPHYKIILSETKNSLRRIIEEDPKAPNVPEAFAFIVDEMAKMEYISRGDADTMKSSAGITPAKREPEVQEPVKQAPMTQEPVGPPPVFQEPVKLIPVIQELVKPEQAIQRQEAHVRVSQGQEPEPARRETTAENDAERQTPPEEQKQENTTTREGYDA
jgi:hypothetical protein